MDKYQIIIKPLITEKGTRQAQTLNAYPFQVHRGANKTQIKQAVEKQFGVHVLSVNTQHYKGEMRTLRNRRVVRAKNWKRAIVTVKSGERIETV